MLKISEIKKTCNERNENMKTQNGIIEIDEMGKNLALNIESRGYHVAVYNRTAYKTDNFTANEAKGKNFQDTYDIASFVQKIEKPRKIILMVQAGNPTDKTIEALLPHLSEGDILVEIGRAHG